MNSAILPTVEVNPRGAPARACVIWLHGLGADGHDFEPIVPELGLPPDAAVRFVFPHAPERPITINGGMVMRGWYDITGLDFGRKHDHEGLSASEQLLRALITRENERGLSSKQIILAGFSQGGAVALQTGLAYPQPLAGILGLSTYLPCAANPAWQRHPANAQTPVFLAHGTDDNLIPLPIAEQAAATLRKWGLPLDWHSYPMGHTVCRAEIAAIGAWLRKTLAEEA